MLERLIKQALNEGIASLTEEPKRLIAYFRKNHGLTKTEAEKIRDVFLKTPPSTVLNFPHKDSPYPLYAIVLDAEKESMKFLNDDGRILTVDDIEEYGDDMVGATIKASIFAHSYHVMVLTKHADVTLYYYELAKYFCFRQLNLFKDNGVLTTAFAGADFMPDPDFIPTNMFGRSLRITFEKALEVVDVLEGRVRSVTGIHVDDGSDAERLGGVRAHVTIDTGEDDG